MQPDKRGGGVLYSFGISKRKIRIGCPFLSPLNGLAHSSILGLEAVEFAESPSPMANDSCSGSLWECPPIPPLQTRSPLKRRFRRWIVAQRGLHPASICRE